MGTGNAGVLGPSLIFEAVVKYLHHPRRYVRGAVVPGEAPPVGHNTAHLDVVDAAIKKTPIKTVNDIVNVIPLVDVRKNNCGVDKYVLEQRG